MFLPIIGIVLDWQNKPTTEGGYSDHPWYALRHHYSLAVANSGGVAVMLPYQSNAIDEYLKLCDGFIFPGGGHDIDPARYGEESKQYTSSANDDRVNFEASLMRAAIENNIPILAICAGEQLLNVLQGGSLYQDIASEVPNALEHYHQHEQEKPWHHITITEGSLLHNITGVMGYVTNSHHHQAIKKIGKNLVATASSADGIIEAIELTSHNFCLGLEWHPEYLQSEYDKKIFAAFIASAAILADKKST